MVPSKPTAVTTVRWLGPTEPPEAKHGDEWDDGQTLRVFFGGEWYDVAHFFRSNT